MKHIYTFLCLFLLGGVAGAEYPKWLCAADSVAGFVYKNEHWIQAKFRITDENYIVSFDSEAEAYTVKKVGNDNWKFSCGKTGLTERLVPIYFECQRIEAIQVIADEDLASKMIGTFSFNSTNGRFLATQHYGYWNVGGVSAGSLVTDENSSTPYVEIGKCSSF